MKKMKTKYKVILYIVMLALIIAVLFCWDEIILPKYEYADSGYAIGSTININGVIYEEINETTYEKIYQEMSKQGIVPFSNNAICRINYKYVDEIWKYKIYGNVKTENRILLKGEEDFAFNDANYPEIYFCRQDILDSIKDTEGE